ncbi:aldehyde ferredoxin oxidoreductase [Candidatus Bipolaricaulota bacterium]|nr:aldehyde ferredoxin oxidoreductase [Candidatus Bipolaricaulota bacterium]
MNSLTTKFEDLPKSLRNLGGRGLTSSIVKEEVPPTCHPLRSNNKLVFAPGMVTGTSAPSSGRLSVGGKSPLTGGIKESNVGTNFAQALARLGVKVIIVEGQFDDRYKLLQVDSEGVSFADATPWSDIGLYEAYEGLRQEFGDQVDICGTGIVGEMEAANSGIVFNDPEGLPSRYSGRGGLGAVMASRGLKFIVLDDEGAPGVDLADEEQFRKGTKKLTNALTEHDVTKPGGTLNSYGTDAMVDVINEAGALPQFNFSKGRDDRAAKVSGEAKAEEIKNREGTRPHACHDGCVIQCSEIWTKPGGEDPVGVLEYESVWSLGPNCGIYDLDTVGELNRACNDLGLDTIEAGATIAVAMEGGLLDFGDGTGALELMDEIREGTSKGRILANGAEFAGQALGVTRVPAVKGQAMPAYDPRAIKGMGVTYATTPMGADHTAGYTVSPEILSVGGEEDPLSSEGKSTLSREIQYATAFIDSTGYCLFTTFATADIPKGEEGLIESVNGVLGTDYTADDILEIGKKIIEKERQFNKEAGFTKEDDRLPEFMVEEELPPHDESFDVSVEQLDEVFET